MNKIMKKRKIFENTLCVIDSISPYLHATNPDPKIRINNFQMFIGSIELGNKTIEVSMPKIPI